MLSQTGPATHKVYAQAQFRLALMRRPSPGQLLAYRQQVSASLDVQVPHAILYTDMLVPKALKLCSPKVYSVPTTENPSKLQGLLLH